MKKAINESELPINELQQLGIHKDGKLKLDAEQTEALLHGRRTKILSLENLKMDGFGIKQLDAKLSLFRNESGKVELAIHPIYHEAKPHPLLNEQEALNLKFGNAFNLRKEYEDANKKMKKAIIEYDEQTREFVAYDPEEVEVPEKVNSEALTDEQKKHFKNGEIVTLSDGTQLQHSATDNKGVRSDRGALILSVLLDGGISYLMLRGIRNLASNWDDQKDDYTKGYRQALQDATENTARSCQQNRETVAAEEPVQEQKLSYKRSGR